MSGEMRETTFLILTALAGGPMHGYGVIREVAELSAGRVKLLPGTLYTALDRLAAQGLVEREREEVHDGRLRRYYRLTFNGLAALGIETARYLELATAAEQRLRDNPQAVQPKSKQPKSKQPKMKPRHA